MVYREKYRVSFVLAVVPCFAHVNCYRLTRHGHIYSGKVLARQGMPRALGSWPLRWVAMAIFLVMPRFAMGTAAAL